MKALSLKQPWLYAIFELDKDIENRTWRPPDYIIGQRIALHASKTVDQEAFAAIKRIAGVDVPRILPRGAVIGTAKIVGWMHENGQEGAVPDPCMAWAINDNKWFFGPVGWILDDIHKFSEPIPAKGALGLWEWQ